MFLQGAYIAPVRQGFAILHGKNNIWRYARNFAADERGATAVEYGLLIGIIGGALILGLGNVRDSLLGVFAAIVDALNSAISS